MASEAVIAYWGLVLQIREFAERTYRFGFLGFDVLVFYNHILTACRVSSFYKFLHYVARMR